MWTYLNGEFTPKEDVRISPFDRGFLFGDSVYEVIPSYDNQLFLFDEHLERLKSSLSITKIPIPDYLTNFNLLITELIQRNEYPNQAIYIQITRGEDAERSHVSSSTISPTLFMSSTELELNPYRLDPNKKGLEVRLEEDIRWKRCDVKATTLLANVMPFHVGDKPEVDEVLFHNGKVINEGSKSNIFCVFDDLIVTPHSEQNILLGITRNYFLRRLLEEGFKVEEKEIKIDDLNKADEVWVTSSTKEIQPIHRINDRVLPEKEFSECYWYKALNILEGDLKANC